MRIQDITPPKMMDESACFKKLTTYHAHTIRKCLPHDPKKEGRGTWARSEIIEERWAQEDIIKQIKKLSERGRGRSVADKKKALMSNQQGQITTLIDNLASGEPDRVFEWSLVQLDSVTKPISVLKGGKKRETYETVSMIAFVKRSPRKDVNAVMLFENIEKAKADRMRPPPPQPQGQPAGPEPPIQIFTVEDGDKDKAPKGRSKSREKKHNERDDSSSGDSFDSDTNSQSSFTGSDSMDTSISSNSHGRRKHNNSKPPFRSHSRSRGHRKTYFLEQRAHSPELHYDPHGGSPRPYVVPDVPPRLVPAALPVSESFAAAYHAGRVDAEAEKYGSADRFMPRPVEPAVIERVRPVPVISYGPTMDHRYSVPNNYADDQYFDDPRREDILRRREEDIFRRREHLFRPRDDMFRPRERDVEEYIIESRLDGQPDGRRTSEFDRRDSFYERRPSSPVIWNNHYPFAPTQLRRRYPRDDNSRGW
jgi:hypothetical protein